MNENYVKHLKDIAFFFNLQKDMWRAKAFNNAANSIEYETLIFENGKLVNAISGVGDAIKKTLEEFHITGTSSKFKTLQKDSPPIEIRELEKIPQIGAQTTKRLWEIHKISSLKDFESKIPDLQNTEFAKFIPLYLQIKNSLEKLPRNIIKQHIDALFKNIDIDFSYAGSMRRGKELLHDVDVIVCLKGNNEKQLLRDRFAELGLTCDVREGDAKWGITVPIGDKSITLDLNFCFPRELGAYKNYLTGCKENNVILRAKAKHMGYLVNQKGIFDVDKQIDDSTEEFLYTLLGIPFIPAPCREVGAIGKDFSNLVKYEDIIADFHTHSTESDGNCEITEVVATAKKLNFKYIGISDHSPGSGNGQHENKKLDAISSFKKCKFEITTLYGAEIDIKTNEELDYSKEVIDKLDYFIVAAHHGQNNLTDRYIHAMEQYPDKPKIIAHPTNRKLGVKPAGEIEWGRLFEACKKYNTVLEINCQPDRLDLDSESIKAAQNAGVILTISSDTHSNDIKELFENGILNAQRGWLMKDACLNANEKLIEKWLQGSLYENRES